MSRRVRQAAAATASVLWLGMAAAAVPALAQSDAPRTPWGHPDLQGVWDHRTITPLERPAELADREFLTAEEAASLEQQAVDRAAYLLNRPPETTTAGGNVDRRADGTPGFYNDFWLDNGTRAVGTRRTSLVIDPPSGRLPALLESAQRRIERNQAYRREHPADSWLDFDATDRCLVGVNNGPPILPAAYNQNLLVVQNADWVLLVAEMIHTVRVVPLDGRPPLPDHVRQWAGDARGRWEGRHAGRRDVQLRSRPLVDVGQPDGPAGDDGEAAPDGALHPPRCRDAGVPGHGGRSRDVEPPVDGVDPDAAQRPAALRVRLPRGQLQHAQHAGGGAGRRAGGGALT